MVVSFLLWLAAPARAGGDPVLPAGATVGGLDLGGLSVESAAARVGAASGQRVRSPLQVRVGGHRRHLTERGGGLALDAEASARRALEAGGSADGARPGRQSGRGPSLRDAQRAEVGADAAARQEDMRSHLPARRSVSRAAFAD